MNNSETMARVYLDAQKSCGLKVGDYVKIVDKVAELAPIWQLWCSENMDKTVGMIGRVKAIIEHGIVVDLKEVGRNFTYPYFVLEKTARPCPFKVGDYVKVMRQEPMSKDTLEKFPRWTDLMDKTLGKVGKVTKIGYDNYKEVVDVKIPEEDRGWTYAWDCLEKVEKPAHEFKPFERVLVRDYDSEIWRCNLFSHMGDDYYICVFSYYKQCIPFKGNEHLCGTTDMPEE